MPQQGFYESSGLEFDNFDLLHREGDGVAMSRWVFDRKSGDMSLVSDEPRTQFSLEIHPLTSQTDTAQPHDEDLFILQIHALQFGLHGIGQVDLGINHGLPVLRPVGPNLR